MLAEDFQLCHDWLLGLDVLNWSGCGVPPTGVRVPSAGLFCTSFTLIDTTWVDAAYETQSIPPTERNGDGGRKPFRKNRESSPENRENLRENIFSSPSPKLRQYLLSDVMGLPRFPWPAEQRKNSQFVSDELLPLRMANVEAYHFVSI
jgi:hypothetical protein